MIKTCKYCRKVFETNLKIKIFCSPRCSYKSRLKNIDSNRFFEREDPEKIATRNQRLNQYIKEANECGLSYGKYRMLRDVYGKNFEEIKNDD